MVPGRSVSFTRSAGASRRFAAAVHAEGSIGKPAVPDRVAASDSAPTDGTAGRGKGVASRDAAAGKLPLAPGRRRPLRLHPASCTRTHDEADRVSGPLAATTCRGEGTGAASKEQELHLGNTWLSGSLKGRSGFCETQGGSPAAGSRTVLRRFRALDRLCGNRFLRAKK